MRSTKTLIILLLITAAVAAAAFLFRDQGVQTDLAGGPLFPDLLERVNDTAEVTLQSAGETMTLKPQGEGWGLTERAGYPADQEGVRELLLGLAQLKRIEAKTSNPERYEEIGLGDPKEEDSASVRITVSDGTGSANADVIVGDRKFGRGNSSLTQLYVRLPEDPQSWLVEGNLPERSELSEWLDSEVLTLEESRIRQVRVTHADGEELLVGRDEATQQDYALDGLSEEENTKSPYDVNGVATTFADLELEDVQALVDEKEYPEPTLTASMETFDGLKVTMEILEIDGKRLARLSADHQAVATAEPEADSESAPGSEPESEPTADAGTESEAADDEDTQTEAQQPAAPAKSAADEAATLNQRWQGWLYELPEYRLESIAKRRADLVEVPEAEEEPAEDKPEGSS